MGGHQSLACPRFSRTPLVAKNLQLPLDQTHPPRASHPTRPLACPRLSTHPSMGAYQSLACPRLVRLARWQKTGPNVLVQHELRRSAEARECLATNRERLCRRCGRRQMVRHRRPEKARPETTRGEPSAARLDREPCQAPDRIPTRCRPSSLFRSPVQTPRRAPSLHASRSLRPPRQELSPPPARMLHQLSCPGGQSAARHRPSPVCRSLPLPSDHQSVPAVIAVRELSVVRTRGLDRQ